MSVDRGQLRTMRLLPFTAAADEAAWVADPGTIVGSASKSACRPGSVTPVFRDLVVLPEMLADLPFHLSRLLTSSCVFSRSGGTETELADLGTLGRPRQRGHRFRRDSRCQELV